jgi:TonB-linked SusC/RagA family outer membrane protein
MHLTVLCYSRILLSGIPKQMLRIMKLTAIILLSACITASAKGDAQGITLSLKNAPLEIVFKEIQKQAGFNFVYNNNLVRNTKPVDLEVNQATVEEVLERCLKDQPLTYSIFDKTIVVKPKDASPNVVTTIEPANIDVNGTVVAESGEAIVGANVIIKGSNRGTSTDNTGSFILRNVNENAILIFSSIGYFTQEIPINGKTILNVLLKVAVNSLDETVVIAYGTTTKRLNTGDVSTVKGTDIQKQPVSNPLAALQGRMPGIFITQNTGMPGGSFNVLIRGKSSIENGTNPLYVIDGVPYTSTLLTNQNPAGGGDPLNFINPSDIESIDVLKDADATAIYGSRGANGVVLITTKKGKSGKSKVDINLYSGIGKVSKFLDLMNTQQYLQMRREAFNNDGVTPTAINAPDLLTWDTTSYTDWQKLLIGGTAHYTDAQVSVSGGNINTQYLIGGGYHRESTVFPGDFADQKASVHFNISNISNNRKFKVLLSGNYLVDDNNLVNYDFTERIQFTPPNTPPYYKPNGTLNWDNTIWNIFSPNPFSYLFRKYKARTYNLVGNALFSYKVAPGFEIKASLGYTNMQVNEVTTSPNTSIDPVYLTVVKNSSRFTNNNIRSWILEPQAIYQRKIGVSNFGLLVGTTFHQSFSEGNYLLGTDYASDALIENIKAASTVSVISTTDIDYKYNALFGRFNYDWKEKYLVNLTARRDGTSRFGPDNQFHNFGAIGMGWVFSKENFIQKKLSFLSYGKFRGSYGTTGNDQVGDYRFLDLYGNTQYSYQNVVGLMPNNLFNPDLAWEENKKLEFGLELGFLKDRILLNSSYYRNRSSNQLINYALPAVTGFTSIANNFPAVVQNTGWEFLLNTSNIKSKDFSWSSSFNITIPKNKLVSFPNLATSPYSYLIIGQPLTIVSLFHLIGVDSQTGVYQFSDKQGNPVFSPSFIDDRTVTVNTAPKFYGGFQNSFQYKSFSVDIFFQFVKQMGRNYLFGLNLPPGFFKFNEPSAILDSWKKPGSVTSTQKYTSTSGSDAYEAYRTYAMYSDQIYTDASFVRLKNLSIAYQLPSKWKKQVHLQDAQLYLLGQNLFTISKYKGRDPESQNNSVLPSLRVLTLGVHMTF